MVKAALFPARYEKKTLDSQRLFQTSAHAFLFLSHTIAPTQDAAAQIAVATM